MKLGRFSMGVGDRFARQGKAQLAAFVEARRLGVTVTPVWNKSNREHHIVHSRPESVRAEADAAVKALGWAGPYHVDADHIGLKTVDAFLAASDFFTLDVADFIGKPAAEADVQAFVERCGKYVGPSAVPGIGAAPRVDTAALETIARKYLFAAQEAGRIHRHVAAAKGPDTFITEVSMDETDRPQSPVELFFILAALSQERVPVQTIAPKFTGRFNKGVEYAGDLRQFEQEFNDDLAVVAFAVREFGLPTELKLSVHSGSDKFSLYAPMRRALRKHKAGLHLKTAGTTWLEELIGLATAGGGGLTLAREIYAQAFDRFDELATPYATVIDIQRNRLPTPAQVSHWTGPDFAAALRHQPTCPSYNSHFRQLLHVAYKIAAQMGERYLDALDAHAEVIAQGVTTNIYHRHLKPLFIDT